MVFLKRVGTSAGKKLTAGLLALLLCVSLPVSALAEGEADPPESAVESQIPPEQEQGEALSGAPAQTEGVPEELTEGENTLESEQLPLSSGSLLLTGGHEPYMNGDKGSNTFRPESPMTRAEVAQMLYNLLAAKPPVTSSRFPDVDIGKWFGTAVNALAQSGVLNGYKDGTFLPNRTITRAEFVTALYGCFSLDAGSASFSDVPETHWAYRYIAAATSAGWIHGVGDNKFEPERGIKRCEAVTVMNAALGRTGDGFAADRDVQKFKDVPTDHWAFLQITEAASPLTADPEPGPSGELEKGQTLRVTASGLNLREGPGTEFRVVIVLAQGASLTVTDTSYLPWVGVKDARGNTGYVSSEYVEVYDPSQASGASLSASTLSFHQYETIRLDGSVTAGLDAMSWSSSDSSVAVVGYTVDYGTGRKEGAMVYGKNPGTATITFSDAAGKTKAACTVTVTAPEGVRFAYASENVAVKGVPFELVAVARDGVSSVNFQIVSGPANGAWTAGDYDTESRNSRHNLPTNTVRVFRRSVTFGAAGTYTVRATAAGHTDHQDFEVLVHDGAVSSTTVTFESRRTSTEGMKVIQNFEGSVPEIEDDRIVPGNPTVGNGYVVLANRSFYNNMTDSEMMGLLVELTNSTYGKAVEEFRSHFNIKMSQAQFDALTSFLYNEGVGTLNSDYGFRRALLNGAKVTASESSPVNGALNVADGAMYADTSLSSKKVADVANKTAVTILEVKEIKASQQVWYRVTTGGKTGWMPAGYVNVPGAGHDLAYVDSTVLANNFLQWNIASGEVWEGLVLRRLAECKVFFFGNYAEAYHSNANYEKNTYGFNFPANCKQYDYR